MLRIFLYLLLIRLLVRRTNVICRSTCRYANISNSVEMVYITGKACEEHTACEGKAFEETVIPLSQQRERETIKAKGFQEHTACEGKAFE